MTLTLSKLLEGASFHFSFVPLMSIKDVKKDFAIQLSDNQLCLCPDASRRSDADAKIYSSKDNVGDQQQYDKVFSSLAQIFGIKTVDGGGGPQKSDERDGLVTARSKSQVFSKDLC